MKSNSLMSNKHFSETNQFFLNACSITEKLIQQNHPALRSVPANTTLRTKRQAAKFRSKKGIVFKVISAISEEKKGDSNVTS